MNLKEIRALIIAAICSDDFLLQTLVLKGGNALNLIYGIGARSSIDVDFSMRADFEDLLSVEKRLFSALRNHFESRGYFIFDNSLTPRPILPPADPTWGGYRAEFKLVDRSTYQQCEGNISNIRKRSLNVGDTTGTRVFRVEISKYEYCDEKEEAEIDGSTCYVYTPPMIAAEKLRAICQQMEGYELVKNRRPRARDFYDIWAIIQARALNLGSPDNLHLVKNIFKAKMVPLHYLNRIPEVRDFHASDWSSVRDSIEGDTREFDYYFDFVVKHVKKLKSLWIKDMPL